MPVILGLSELNNRATLLVALRFEMFGFREIQILNLMKDQHILIFLCSLDQIHWS